MLLQPTIIIQIIDIEKEKNTTTKKETDQSSALQMKKASS
jgi:hypothetical protein